VREKRPMSAGSVTALNSSLDCPFPISKTHGRMKGKSHASFICGERGRSRQCGCVFKKRGKPHLFDQAGQDLADLQTFRELWQYANQSSQKARSFLLRLGREVGGVEEEQRRGGEI
jgi:hypothetical protein